MLKACVLLACEPGKYREVAKALKGMKGVTKAFATMGRWDAVARIEARDVVTLGKIAVKINGTAGVKASETLIGF